MDLNAQQLRAITSNSGCILTIAGPGSGKTRVLVERVKRLIDDGTPSRSIACITFTNAAAHEMSERIGNVRLGYIGTLHSFMLRILNRYGNLIGFAGKISVMDEASATELLKETVAEMHYTGSMERLKETLSVCPLLERRGKPSPQSLVAIAYEKKLVQNCIVDYDHILSFGYHVLKTRKDMNVTMDGETAILHMLIDEFQDSGDWDAAIYNQIEVPNKFFVGDPDQSVYGFRGGNVRHILDLGRSSDVETIRLQINYRSDQSICGAAQRLIEHNTDRLPKSTIPNSTEPGVVQFEQHDTPTEETAWLIQQLNGHDHEETAILLRTNRLVETFATALRAASVPVAERRMSHKPDDWTMTKLAVGFLAQPNNDFLAYRMSLVLDGLDAAAKLRQKAMGEFTSINALRFHVEQVPLDAIPGQLARYSICDESIAIVRAKLADLPEFSSISDLLLAMNTENEAEQIGHGVTVCTMHAAKGREFNTVFLPSFEQAIIPSERKSLNLEEERRLAYVAITRARHKAVVSWCRHRIPMWGAQKLLVNPVPQEPSQFVHEMQIE